jgi:hypothetical protein
MQPELALDCKPVCLPDPVFAASFICMNVLLAAVPLTSLIAYSGAQSRATRETVIEVPATPAPCYYAPVMFLQTDYPDMVNWHAVYHTFKHGHYCDYGQISDAYAERIVRLLEQDWQ